MERQGRSQPGGDRKFLASSLEHSKNKKNYSHYLEREYIYKSRKKKCRRKLEIPPTKKPLLSRGVVQFRRVTSSQVERRCRHDGGRKKVYFSRGCCVSCGFIHFLETFQGHLLPTFFFSLINNDSLRHT